MQAQLPRPGVKAFLGLPDHVRGLYYAYFDKIRLVNSPAVLPQSPRVDFTSNRWCRWPGGITANRALPELVCHTHIALTVESVVLTRLTAGRDVCARIVGPLAVVIRGRLPIPQQSFVVVVFKVACRDLSQIFFHQL